jgi:hypothetical protein
VSALALYELAAQYRQLQDLADTDDLPAEVIRDTLEGLTGEIEAKSINVAKFVLSLEAHADAISDAAKQMTDRAQRVRNRAESIRAYLLFQMQATGTTKITCPEFTMAVRSNPPAVGLRDDVELPAEYMAKPPEPPPPRPDKRAILDALKSGKQIDGAWIEQGQRLEIRT